MSPEGDRSEERGLGVGKVMGLTSTCEGAGPQDDCMSIISTAIHPRVYHLVTYALPTAPEVSTCEFDQFHEHCPGPEPRFEGFRRILRGI